MLNMISQGVMDMTGLLDHLVMGAYHGSYGYGYGYGYLSYLVFMLPALLLGLWAQAKVTHTFNKYNKISNSRNITGAQAARMILDKNGLSHIRIEHVSGKLTDHYDPRDGVLRLSSSVHDSTSIGAVGVAAHEAGHAIQDAEEYAPIRIRNAIVPVCNLGSSIVFFGILLFSLVAVFQLVTLPVEFDASSRALSIIRDSGMFAAGDYKGAKKVLSAAAMTYVAALITSVMQILYYVTRFLGGARRDD